MPKVEFSADTLRLNLIDLARTGSKLIQVAGRVDYQCPSGDPQDPVTFTTRESYLVSDRMQVARKVWCSSRRALCCHLLASTVDRRKSEISTETETSLCTHTHSQTHLINFFGARVCAMLTPLSGRILRG